jgi:glutathione S-transferase
VQTAAAPRIVLYIQPSFQVPGRARFFSGTPFAVKVQRILQFKRLAFEVREVAWADREAQLPRLSTARKLPVLEYDGRRIEDSTLIAHFLEERHPAPPLLPVDPVRRALCHFLEEWADEVLYWYGIYEQRRISPPGLIAEAYFADHPEPVRRSASEALAKAVEENLDRQGLGRYPVDKVKADVRRGLDSLASLIEATGWAAGPKLTLADLALFGQLHRRLAGTNPWLEQEFAARPVLVDWLGRVDRATSA